MMDKDTQDRLARIAAAFNEGYYRTKTLTQGPYTFMFPKNVECGPTKEIEEDCSAYTPDMPRMKTGMTGFIRAFVDFMDDEDLAYLKNVVDKAIAVRENETEK